jgi:serine/threonine protein kinase/Flp pilus assembly protein TadD
MIGTTILHYKITGRLGKGGMGEVFVAEDTRLKRKIALKILPSEIAADSVATERFQREAEAIAALNHPNIVTIHSVEESGTTRFITMELVDGATLGQMIPPTGMTLQAFFQIAIPLTEALSAAHERGIIHRDLKPANIMVSKQGRVKVLDFGLAKLSQDSSDPNISQLKTYEQTSDGTVLGTIPYMSPEQINGKRIDQRSDLFSLGVIFYEMISGQRPFQGETAAELITSILRDTPLPPKYLDQIILRCLMKEPKERYQAAREIIQEFQRVSEQNISQRINVPAATSQTSIAVMSFADLSPQKDQEYFCDGIAEELINALSKLEEIRVVSRTSSFQFKGKEQDIRKIGEQLNVGCILEGSVRKAGNRLRITAQLTNVLDGFHLWTERYDREMEDIFAIQDEIAHSIVKNLRGQITGAYSARMEEAYDRLDDVLDKMKTLVKKPTDNLEAYSLYLKGRYFWNKQTDEDLVKGIECFKQAAACDPNYALAYSGMAACYALLANWGGKSSREILPKMRDAVQRALSLDNSIAEAHSIMGYIKTSHDWNWIEAEKEHWRAFELNPNDSHVSIFLMACLGPQGKFEEAIEKAKHAQNIDPASAFVSVCLAWTYYIARRFDESIKECKKGLELEPNFHLLHWVLGLCYEQKGMLDIAIKHLEKARTFSADSPLILGELGRNYALAGRPKEARDLIENLHQQSAHRYVSPLNTAVIYIGLKEIDAAFESLEKAYADGGDQLYWMKVNPRFDAIRSDPRYANLISRMNL